jgi:hypothetical protein
MIGLVGKLLGEGLGLIDKFVLDKDVAEKLKAQFKMQALNYQQQELNAQKEIIVAEAKGESPLQRNWRPLTMLTLVGLVVAHWFGYTPENLSQEAIEGLFTLVQIGLGGYVIGRSGEKMIDKWKN